MVIQAVPKGGPETRAKELEPRSSSQGEGGMSGYVLRRSLLSLLTLGAILVVAGGVVVALGVPVWIPAIVAVVLIAVQYMLNPLLMQWLVPATRIPATPDGSGYETDHALRPIVARRRREAGLPLLH